MAKQKTIILSGSIANVIFYEFRGTPCARSKPARVKQTKATKASAKLFGQAAYLSKMLRSGLNDLLPDPKNKRMMYRLNSALLKWLLNRKPDKSKLPTDIPFVDEFEFNEETSLRERLKLQLSVQWINSGKIIIDIPDIVPTRDIAAPAHTQAVHWQIRVVSCTKDTRSDIMQRYSIAIETPYNEKLIPAKQIELPFIIMPGHIAVVCIALKYTVIKKGLLNEVTAMSWLPAGIVGTFCKTG